MNIQSEQLLKDFNLRTTASRQVILDFFLQKNYALSHSDLENEIADRLDRVTVYRTLKTFLDKGLIHKVLDDEGALKYALCTDTCTPKEGHHHDHVHFKCVKCGQTNCLAIEVPNIKLPKGYYMKEADLLIQGICNHCA